MSVRKNEPKRHCHAHECNHRRVKFCQDCKSVYCAECKQQWHELQSPSPYWWSTAAYNNSSSFHIDTVIGDAPKQSQTVCVGH